LDTQGILLLAEQRGIALRDITLKRVMSLEMLEKKEDGDVGNSALYL
jgi:hypothetical protein